MNVRQSITIAHKFVLTLMDHMFVLVKMDTKILEMGNVKVKLKHSHFISSNNSVVNFIGIFSCRY